MCFSATASLLTATFTGAVGVVAVLRAQHAREMPLALVPLAFAFQQFIEGAIWTTTAVGGTASPALTQAFLVFALVFWPAFTPIAALSIETDPLRRKFIGACLAIGLGVAIYFTWQLAAVPHDAGIVDGHIRYDVVETPVIVGGTYLVATTLPFLVSTLPAVGLLGLVVLSGSIVTYAAYAQAFVSVWCFFAAAGSALVAGHFGWLRRWPAPAV